MTNTGNPLEMGEQTTMSNSMNFLRASVLPRRGAGPAILLAALLSLGACDYFDVTNPGPVHDGELDNLAAHEAVVAGSARALSDALNNVAYTTAAITRELFPAGSTSSFGITPRQQQGILAYDDEHTGWFSHHQARFIAEHGFERFETTLAAEGKTIDDYELGGRIALWAGYANRLLGENWCQVTIDGSAAIPSREILKRAAAWFTTAAQIGERVNQADAKKATDLIQAAYAGRASVRVGLNEWPGAVADAGKVGTSFKFVMDYSNTELDQHNRIYWAGAGTPYRAHTVWRTVNEQYYKDTGDPRVAWIDTNRTGDAAVMDLGRVPHFQQRKHPDRASDINLSSGREMRLIEAEAKLIGEDWSGALTIINSLRTAAEAPLVSATNITETWTLLKRERGIELWLEGRRMHDLRRWKASNTPGALDPLEDPSNQVTKLLPEQSLCYDIPKSERETNPNVPLTPGS